MVDSNIERMMMIATAANMICWVRWLFFCRRLGFGVFGFDIIFHLISDNILP